MGLFRRRPGLPPELAAELFADDRDARAGRTRGEQVLAVARDERTDGYVVATTTRLAALPAPAGPPATGPILDRLVRPWHEVAGGAWEPMTATVSVTWVDGGRAAQWTLRAGGERFAQVFYDRVQASVVIDAPVEMSGRTVGRVAIRRDLATGEPLRQVAWGRGAARDDPAAQHYAAVLLDHLAEQAGMA